MVHSRMDDPVGTYGWTLTCDDLKVMTCDPKSFLSEVFKSQEKLLP